MKKEFNTKKFRLVLIARRDLYYGQWLTPTLYIHNRGVKYYLGKFLNKDWYWPNLFSSFIIEILWFRWAIGFEFIKWKNK